MMRRCWMAVLAGSLGFSCGHPEGASVAVPPVMPTTQRQFVGEARPAPLVVTELVSNNSGRLAAPIEAFDGDDPPLIAAMALNEPPSTWVDDRTPYGVVVAAKGATSVTLAWRTETATRGIVSFGRVWGFAKNGYTGSYTDDVAKTDHQVTITGLRRFTAYQYRVTAVTALGLEVPEKERTVRTRFWAWR